MKLQLFLLALICSVFMTGLVMAAPVANDDAFTIYAPTVNLEEAAIIANDDPLLASTYSDFNALNVSYTFRGEITGFDGYLGLFNYTNNGSSGVDYFYYILTNGTNSSNQALVVIATGDNTAPSFNFTTRNYNNNDSNVTLVVNSSDGLLSNITNLENDKLFIIITKNVSFGNLSVDSDGSFNYTSNKTNGVDYFKYKVSDLSQESAEITVIIVIGNNTAPTALKDVYTLVNASVVANDVNVTASVMANDSDAENDILFAHLNSTTTNGTLDFNLDGSFVYFPNVNFSGIDSFTYYITDQNLNSSIVNVTLYVNTTAPSDNTGGSGDTGDSGSSSNGGGSNGGTCVTQWNCTAWSVCSNGTQVRTCSYPTGFCAPKNAKPIVQTSCVVANANNNTNSTSGSEDRLTNVVFDKFNSITGAVTGSFAKAPKWVYAFIAAIIVALIVLLILKKIKSWSKKK